jgi:hypothetical protein
LEVVGVDVPRSSTVSAGAPVVKVCRFDSDVFLADRVAFDLFGAIGAGSPPRSGGSVGIAGLKFGASTFIPPLLSLHRRPPDGTRNSLIKVNFSENHLIVG